MKQGHLQATAGSERGWKEKTAGLFKVLVMLFFALPGTFMPGVVARAVSQLEGLAGGDLAFRAGRLWARFIMLITGGKIDVEGIKHLDPSMCYIFVANHQSLFDIIAVMGYLPIQFCWVAKKELFKIPFFGKSMASIGCIPMDRFRSKSAFRSLEMAMDRVQQGRSIVIFPEGSRSRGGRIQSFKAGAFYLAQKTGCPVVPLVLLNTEIMMPRGTFIVNPCRMKIIITPAIVPDPTSKTRDELAIEVWQRIISIRERHADPCADQRIST